MNYLPDDDIVLTVSKLLETCGIPHTIDFIRDTLLSHPDYPSLLSLSESLLEWGIETNAVRGTINDLSEADYPSIAYLKNNRYVVLESIKNNKVTVIFPTKGRISLTMDEFDKAWSGIILRVSPSENAREKDFNLHRRNHLLKRVQQFLTFPGLFLFGLAAFTYLALNSTGLTILIPLGITKLIGLSACVALFAGHTGQSRIFESICPSGRISNCHRVMDSPAGKILGIPMADLGILYFSSGFLVLFTSLLSGQLKSSLFTLAVLSVLVLPYTFFSIAYQAFVIRSWCRLCLLVQILFWIEFALFYFIVFAAPGEAEWMPQFPVIFGFGSVLLLWLMLRPIFKSYLLRTDKEAEVTRLYSQPDFIELQLSKAIKTDIGHFPFEVEIGATDASVTLLQVINPLCRHCGKSLEEMMEVINSSGGKIKGIIRFLVDSADENMTASQKRLDQEVALDILKMAAEGRREDVRDALMSWFSNKHGFSRRFLKKWRQRYANGADDADKKVGEMLILHRQWAVASDIQSIPTLFMNDLRLPHSMGFKDLKFFLLRMISN